MSITCTPMGGSATADKAICKAKVIERSEMYVQTTHRKKSAAVSKCPTRTDIYLHITTSRLRYPEYGFKPFWRVGLWSLAARSSTEIQRVGFLQLYVHHRYYERRLCDAPKLHCRLFC